MTQLRHRKWVRRGATLVLASAAASAVVVVTAVAPASADAGNWFHNLMHKIDMPHDEMHRAGIL